MRHPHLPLTLDGLPATLVAGVDEAGRGPLAGDVVAAAVILDADQPIDGLRDSKKLTARQRESLYSTIQQRATAFAIARANVEEIDRLNILQASLLAMTRAVQALAVRPAFIYVDGNRCPAWTWRSRAVVQGEERIAAIAAASILAKVTRDREMEILDGQYPGYGLASHKGYGTAMHLEALRRLGPCEIHRRTFGPVAEILDKGIKR